MGKIGFSEVLLIAFVFVLLFGVKKLPELGASIGEAIKQFKRATKELDNDVKEGSEDKKK